VKHPGLIGVLVGVGGEVYFDWKEEKGKNARWKRFFMALLLVSLAYELYEASQNDKEAATAIKMAGQANERAAAFDADRVVVEKEAEEIRSTNFVLQAKVLELESRLQPRAITSGQASNLVAYLSKAPEKGEVSIFASILDPEAMNFAAQIDHALRRAGFEVHRPAGFTDDAMLSIGPPGAHMVVRGIYEPHPRTAFIQRCFSSVGIELPAIESWDTNLDSNAVEIDVGQK
ncbi:MAG TPA: hypothetical protein VGY98_08680, partial [Verrucomicrobiae bacterium]|nr:hypothetical protein [Verrucomicrobiae bacterium]